MKKEFSRNDLAAIKRAAASIAPFAAKRDRLIQKMTTLQEELAILEGRISSYNTPIVELTGGYTAEDLVVRDETGKFVFKYPDTITPSINLEEIDTLVGDIENVWGEDQPQEVIN